MMGNRYDRYKDSGIAWIGEIPEHWCLALVKAIFNRRTKKNNPILTEERLSLSIEKGVTLYSEKTTNLDRFKEDFTQYQIAYPNDIVLNSMNMIVGAIGISHYLGCVSPVYYVITPKDKNINVKYYGYLLNNFRIRNLYHALGEGIYAIDRGEGRINTCRLKVSYDKFGSIIIPIPSINEQQSIAAYLDQKCGEIDELITLQEEMITKLQSYKQSVITEAVTKGLDKNVPLKDSGIEWIGEIPEHWEVVDLRHLCKKITDGSHFSPQITDEGGFYITVSNVFDDKIHFENAHKISIKDFNTLITNGCQPPIGSVLLTKDGTVGRTAVVTDNNFVVLSSLAILSLKSNILAEYVKYVLDSETLQEQMKLLMAGSALRRITLNKIYTLKMIYAPSSFEQQAIADYLDQKCSEIDELISIKQQKIEKLKEYKKSLIFECVTGKRKVS